MKSYLLLAPLVLAGAACSSILGAGDCTTEAVTGLEVTVRDSATGLPAGRSAVVIAREGAYADTAEVFLPPGVEVEVEQFALAIERRGTYEVTVTRAGYRPWRRTGVRVRGDECHVRTTRITALLQRLP